MTAQEAAAVLRKEVKFKKEDTIRKKNSKLIRAANALRNAELEAFVGAVPYRRRGNGCVRDPLCGQLCGVS